MDNRLYFILGDLLSNVLVGSVVGGLSWLIVGPQWNMFLAMFVMMLVGMLVALSLFIPASIMFGAMEIMLPIMVTGMLSGMVVGMWIPMSPLSVVQALKIGAGCGLLSILGIWYLNHQLRGVRPIN